MKLLDKILGAMKDDKGMFQGGQYGRVGGRFLDATDNQQYAHQTPIGEQPNYDNMPMPDPGQKILGQDIMKTPRNEPVAGELSPAGNRLDYLVQNFDPSSNDSVLELQKALNSSGSLGKKLSEDGKFGKKTLEAVRSIQSARDGQMDMNPGTSKYVEGPPMAPAKAKATWTVKDPSKSKFMAGNIQYPEGAYNTGGWDPFGIKKNN
tara:strand:+ start:57 stop:674 length:618 start_codon:yes stop_codon:yes gene_type:complete